MEGTEVGHKLSGPDLRKQKLMEYLASKGRLKPPNPKPYLRDDLDPKRSRTIKRTHGKENQVSHVSTHKHGGPELHTDTQKAKCATKAKLLERTSGCGSGKRAPLTSVQNNASCMRNQSNVKGPDAVTARVRDQGQPDPVRDRVVRRQTSKAQQPVLSACAKVVPNNVQSGQNKQRSASQARGCSSLANKGPLCTSKPPLLCTLRNSVTASQTLQGKAETQKKPQQVPKTAQRTDHVGANRVTMPKSCINSRPPQGRLNTSSRPSQVTYNTSKTPGQTLKSTSSASCNAKSVKPQENLQKRTMSTTTMSCATGRAGGQPPKLKPLGQGATQAKNSSRGAKLQSGRLNENQRATALCRKPPSSVVAKPVTTSQTTSRTSQASAPQSKARAVAPSGGTQQEVAAPKMSSFSLPPSKSGLRRRPITVPASVTKMASLFAKSTEPSLGPDSLKTPVSQSKPRTGVPATEPMTGTKKPTAAQAERLRKLQEWREAKGITYKRPPMPIQQSVKKSIAVPQHYWASMEEEDESQRLTYAVERALSDCLDLLQLGCSSEQVLGVLSRIPMAHKFCKYWMCRARLMEREGNFEVLPLFEEAVRVVREPINDLRAVVFEILKKRDTQTNFAKDTQVEAEALEDKDGVAEEKETEDVSATPKRVSVAIRAAKGGSSVVKYKITATPNGHGSQHQEPLRFNGQELRFFTPVRRSVRIERSAPRYPSALQEQGPCVYSSRHLPSTETSPIYVYVENEALKDQVQVQLFQEDDEPDPSGAALRCVVP
ncbi:hypothetical protein ACEWY4_011933 [Coilia grayii]|uniref:Cytoskeleton-associated protein 2 C-terminal domain-containing protein n=1 Tax=Coilia grayii TaxID=363190 RepID=A0ABD1JZ39_9TELE